MKIGNLAVWIESRWLEWDKHGVSLWSFDGQTIFGSEPFFVLVGPNLKLSHPMNPAPMLFDQVMDATFRKVEIGFLDTDLDLNRAKALIEAAVTQEAA